MIDEERFIIEEEEKSEKTVTDNSIVTKFPVRTQLFLVGSLLLVIFAGFIVPKSLALLSPEKNQAELPSSLALDANSQKNNFPKKIESISLKAEAAYVWDIVGQRVLFEKNADEELPLASITKLMTALVAYELVPDDKLVTISEKAANQQSGGGFMTGEKYQAKELADFALISSHNSAAYTLADSVGELLGDEDSIAQFVAAMNIEANELGLNSLKYENPTGLDISATEAGAYGNARDTTFLVEHILLKHPEILTPTITEHIRLYNQNGDYHEANNTNDILTDIPNLLGSKTGYTDLAGGNLTVAFDAGYNRPIIVTVLGSTRNERFSDVKKLVAEVKKSMYSKE